MRKTKKIVLCAILSSVGFALIAIFSLLETLNISIAFIVSLIILFVLVELDFKYAIMTYAVISLLSVLILGWMNFASFCFVFYIGHYPIVKYFFDKLPKVFAFICKLVFANALILSSYFLFKNIVLPETYSNLIMILLFILANATYILGDRFYDIIKLLYLRKFRDKIKKYLN